MAAGRLVAMVEHRVHEELTDEGRATGVTGAQRRSGRETRPGAGPADQDAISRRSQFVGVGGRPGERSETIVDEPGAGVSGASR